MVDIPLELSTYSNPTLVFSFKLSHKYHFVSLTFFSLVKSSWNNILISVRMNSYTANFYEGVKRKCSLQKLIRKILVSSSHSFNWMQGKALLSFPTPMLISLIFHLLFKLPWDLHFHWGQKVYTTHHTAHRQPTSLL